MSNPIPDPQPSGALVPPRHLPPTAVGTLTPEPPRAPRPIVGTRRPSRLLQLARRVALRAMDLADELAARVTGTR